MKILSVLDDHEEMMRGGEGRRLNSLKEMGAMTVVKQSEAIGKRVIQTRWVDREKDGRVKPRLALKDYNRCQGATQSEMFSPTPSRRDCCAWSARLETSVDSEREEDANDRATGRAGDSEASRGQNSRVKAVVACARSVLTSCTA